MSRMRSVSSDAYTLTASLAPAVTMAAFALVRPSNEFNVETDGRGVCAGQTVRYRNCPEGTAVTFSENAVAVEGMLHSPNCGTTKFCQVPACSGVCVCRVSTRRHEVTGTNWEALGAGPVRRKTVPPMPKEL